MALGQLTRKRSWSTVRSSLEDLQERETSSLAGAFFYGRIESAAFKIYYKWMRAELIWPFLFGLAYGSFLNVVIYRLDDWLSILKGRSQCQDCRAELRWYDLLPVISFALLGAKCRYCRKSIHWQYPLVELATAILVAAGYGLVFSSGLSLDRAVISFIFYALAIGSMVVIFCHDLKEMMIPDAVSYFLLISSIIFSLTFSGSVKDTLIAALIGFLPIALLVYPSRGQWMGEGDVKLAIALGVMVGYPSAIVFLTTAFISGGVIGILIMLTRRGGLRTAVPFAPFLIIGAIVGLFYGPQLVHWYLGMLGYFY